MTAGRLCRPTGIKMLLKGLTSPPMHTVGDATAGITGSQQMAGQRQTCSL